MAASRGPPAIAPPRRRPRHSSERAASMHRRTTARRRCARSCHASGTTRSTLRNQHSASTACTCARSGGRLAASVTTLPAMPGRQRRRPPSVIGAAAPRQRNELQRGRRNGSELSRETESGIGQTSSDRHDRPERRRRVVGRIGERADQHRRQDRAAAASRSPRVRRRHRRGGRSGAARARDRRRQRPRAARPTGAAPARASGRGARSRSGSRRTRPRAPRRGAPPAPARARTAPPRRGRLRARPSPSFRRSAGAGRPRLAREPLAQMARGHVSGEEAALVADVAGEIEALDRGIAEWRQHALGQRLAIAALMPAPRNLAAQPQRHLVEPPSDAPDRAR